MQSVYFELSFIKLTQDFGDVIIGLRPQQTHFYVNKLVAPDPYIIYYTIHWKCRVSNKLY